MQKINAAKGQNCNLMPLIRCALHKLTITRHDDLANARANRYANDAGVKTVVEIKNANLRQHQNYNANGKTDLQEAIGPAIKFRIIFLRRFFGFLVHVIWAASATRRPDESLRH